MEEVATLRAPRTAFVRWLVEPGRGVPAPIRAALIESLFGSLPIFFGGAINTVAVSTLIALRIPKPEFILWAAIEFLVALVRLPVLMACRRAARARRPGPTDLYVLLAILWSITVGYGAFISIWSGDWPAATLASVSAAAMIGGICFRNFGTPRLATLMVVLSFGPCAFAGITSGEPIMLVGALQLPMYLFAMGTAAFSLHKMLVRSMCAELESDRRARHDPLTGLLNRGGLAATFPVRIAAAAPLAFCFMDLDGFKRVNDTLGHAAGDELLAGIAARLRALAGPEATIARLGGDEFLVVAEIENEAQARRLGDTIITAIGDRPYLLGPEAVLIGVSVGIALYPEHGNDLDTLLAAADAALYEAKSNGRSRCVVAGRRYPAPYLVPLKNEESERAAAG